WKCRSEPCGPDFVLPFHPLASRPILAIPGCFCPHDGMRYPNFRNGSRVVFSTRKQRGPLWQAPGRATRPLCPRRGELAHNFIVQCRKSQRPGCMADTTGPMPLIRWRDDGKHRLGLALTSLWTEGSLEPKTSGRGSDGLVEKVIPVCVWALEAH